jgi:NAD(P)-dependent dehydrogenase (short-subunit alcohol dehydrogenase family)
MAYQLSTATVAKHVTGDRLRANLTLHEISSGGQGEILQSRVPGDALIARYRSESINNISSSQEKVPRVSAVCNRKAVAVSLAASSLNSAGGNAMGRLDGKVALIVGGGADGPPNPGEPLSIGNGRATAIMCAREGAMVMVADKNPAFANETASAIREEEGRADSFAADVSKEDDCRHAVEEAVRRFGKLNLLVNNVGIAVGRSLLNTTTDEFNLMYEVNLRSHFLMMRFALPEMVKAGGGAIVNVSSVAALLSGSGIAYEATKAALLGLSRSVAVRYASDNVRVNAILPGLINSSMVRREIGDREARVAPRIPMGRQGTPWEIAKAVVFLLSDDASYITGTQLIVDGGITAGEGMRRRSQT